MAYNCRGKCHRFEQNIGKRFSQIYEVSKNQKRCRQCKYVCERSSISSEFCPCCGCRYKFRLPRYQGNNKEIAEMEVIGC